MLFVILELTNIVSNRLFSQFTSINKLPLIIKVPLVNVLNFILFPFHSSWNFTSLIILSIKFISIFYIHFLSLSVEKVVFELTIIHETLGDVWTILEHVVGEFSLCVWSIFENQNTLTISFSIREWTNVKRSVIFVKSTISTGVPHDINRTWVYSIRIRPGDMFMRTFLELLFKGMIIFEILLDGLTQLW